MATSNLAVEFILKGDGNAALQAINAVQKGMNKLTDSFKNDINGKLKSLVGAAAIEQIGQRTAEWAYNLTQVSKGLGVTTQDLQIFNIIGNNAKLSEGKVTEFFTSFSNARDEAIKGNQDMIQSLQAMGITFNDVVSKTDTVSLFEKFMGNKDLMKVERGSAMSRAVENVFGGGNLYNVQSMIGAAGPNAMNPAKYGNQIVPDKDVAELTAMWTEVKNNLKKAFTESIPAIKIIVQLINTFVKALLGLIEFISDALMIGSGIIHGDTKKMLEGLKRLGFNLTNQVAGLLKTFTTLIDGIANVIATWLKKIPGLGSHIKDGKSLTGYITKGQDWVQKKLGFAGNKEMDLRREHAEAIGEVAPLLVGEGEIQKGLSAMFEGASGKLLSGAVKAEGLSAKLATYAPEAPTFMGRVKNMIAGPGTQAFEGRMMASELMGKASGKLFDLAAAAEKLGPASKWIAGIGSAIGIAGSLLIANSSIPSLPSSAAPGRRGYNAQIIQQNPFVANGESIGMLKFGGIFGAGIQLRMIRLTEQMISILNQIQRNTTYFNPYNVTNPNNTPSGGI